MSKKPSMGGRLGNSLPEPAAIKDDDPMKDYESKEHLDTLMRAEMIKADPEKMKKVHKLAGRHEKAIRSIKDLRDTYDEKFGMGALRRKSSES
jgi:hypothetical protein